VSALKLLLRFYSYLAHAAISLAALAMSALVLTSPNHTVRIGWLPWSGDPLGAWLAGVGISGVAVIILALAGRFRWLFPAFSLAVTWVVLKGIFFSPWQFENAEAFKSTLWLSLALLLALLGTIPPQRSSR